MHQVSISNAAWVFSLQVWRLRGTDDFDRMGQTEIEHLFYGMHEIFARYP